MTQKSPKVFISHASDDKERFVEDFATRLRKEKGVDAWFDKWEILPGDSLVDKLFEEGLKEADVVIIILSGFSVNKPWVKEELNLSVVKRIEKGMKIIPVVLDDCQIPEALKATVWERIGDLQQYDNEFERIVGAIYGQNDKPALGLPPKYVDYPIQAIGALTRNDNILFKLLCDFSITSNSMHPLIDILPKIQELLSEEDMQESLEVLRVKGYVGNSEATLLGMDEYAKVYIDNYEDVQKLVISQIVNNGLRESCSLHSVIDAPNGIISHVIDLLDSKNYIKIRKMESGSQEIHTVSPSLKRLLS